MSARFRNFASHLLETKGALVAPVEPLGLEVILPTALQQTLDLPEHGTLAFSGEVPDGWRRVVLESDWLDRLGGLLANDGREARLQLATEAVTAPANPERILEHRLRLNNAVYRLQGVEECYTQYVLHTFRYTAISDEKRDGLIQIGRNLSNHGVLEPWVTTLLQACHAEREDLNISHDPLSSTPYPILPQQEEWQRLTHQQLPHLA